MTGFDPTPSAGNLPANRTSFVGRRREIDAVQRLLRTQRLVTLIGGAGVGKTRLALRVAKELTPSFGDGVWLVELSANEDAAFLPQTVAQAVGVRHDPTHALREVLGKFLADKELLLVLDNCEHVVGACARLVHDLLRTAPRLRILATSRQRLHAEGEWLFEVPPLSVPEGEGPATARSEAVRLFAERAALALSGFTVNASNRATVVRLCQRLEGIPLAIELAAARVRAMPVEAILAGLEGHYLEALSAGARVAVPRLETLQASLVWSYDLCSAEEQRLWARVSVFRGGFDLDAAERVCSGDGIADADVFDLIADLVDKSVLLSSRGGQSMRYRMLETIREYGAQRLASSGETTVTRMRHRDYFGELVRRTEQNLLGSGEAEAFTRLDRDHANLQGALEFCLADAERARAGLEMVAVPFYWAATGRHSEGRVWLDRALAADSEACLARARALWGNAWLALMQADWDAARSLIDQGRVLAHRLGDPLVLAHATRLLGDLEFLHGDVHRADALLEDALARLRALDDRAGVWLVLRNLTLATALLGDADRARHFGELCVNLTGTPGATITRAWSLAIHGLAQWLTGDHRFATQLVRECLRISPAFSEEWGVTICLEVLAWDAAARHKPDRVARLLGAAHRIWRLLATPPAAEHARCEQSARAALEGPTFDTLFDEGARFTIDQAVAYALSEKTVTIESLLIS